MKRIVVTIAILLGMTLGSFAQFGSREGGVTYSPIMLPLHGQIENQEAFLALVTQTTILAGGWNRFSVSVEIDDPVTMLQTLEGQLDEVGMVIESPEGSTTNYGDGFWFGDIDNTGITNEEMLLILVSEDAEDVTVELQGAPATPDNHPITILPEAWNRIGFPCTEPVSVMEALADFEAEDGDIIESVEGSIQYYEGAGWFGDFYELTPGIGYMFYSASLEERTLIFSMGSK